VATSDSTASELGVRLGVAVWEFWSRYGYQSEGQRWLEEALARFAPDLTDVEARHLRARGLSAAGNLATYHGDVAAAERLLTESLALFQTLEDPWWIAYVLQNLGMTFTQRENHGRAVTFLEESLSLFRQLEDHWGTAWALLFLAGGEFLLPDADSVPGATDRTKILMAEESLSHFREVGDISGISTALGLLGRLEARQGNPQRARALLHESLVLQHELRAKGAGWLILMELARLVAEAHERDSVVRAVQLYAAAEMLFKSTGQQSWFDATRARHQETIRALQARLGETAFAAAWATGQAMSLEQAVVTAFQVTDQQPEAE
jgi:tetratricopeptide (TPR) repeat protein